MRTGEINAVLAFLMRYYASIIRDREKVKKINDFLQIKEIAIIDIRTEKLIQKFMPGPITLVLRKKEGLPEYITNEWDTIAVRMATSKALEELIRKTGSPLFMSSANQSGEPTCKNLEEIERCCPNLDGMMEGEVSFGIGSTIVDCTSNELKILREGPISIEQIKEELLH